MDDLNGQTDSIFFSLFLCRPLCVQCLQALCCANNFLRFRHCPVSDKDVKTWNNITNYNDRCEWIRAFELRLCSSKDKTWPVSLSRWLSSPLQWHRTCKCRCYFTNMTQRCILCFLFSFWIKGQICGMFINCNGITCVHSFFRPLKTGNISKLEYFHCNSRLWQPALSALIEMYM